MRTSTATKQQIQKNMLPSPINSAVKLVDRLVFSRCPNFNVAKDLIKDKMYKFKQFMSETQKQKKCPPVNYRFDKKLQVCAPIE